MYLYKKNDNNSIIVYSFVSSNEELIKFKKKHLEDIKSVILHINNHNTQNILFSSPKIMFSALDRKESNGRISCIEETNSDKIISRYISGEFDFLVPLYIIGDGPVNKSFYSGDLYNSDSTLLFTGGNFYNNEFITDEGVLLTGCLGDLQPLLSCDVNNLIFTDIFEDLDDEAIDFLKLFNCTRERIIKLDDLKFMQENGLIEINENLQEVFEKSEDILNSYNKVKRKIKNN